MKTFAEAQKQVVALAEKGDLKGIDTLLKRLLQDGADPSLVNLLGTYRESAMLNLGKQ